jgi:hypothetical protein
MTLISLDGFVCRHRLDADPDPDPTFPFDADPDRIPYGSYLKFLFTFWKIRVFFIAGLHCFIFLISAIDFKIFSILDSILKFSLKKFSLYLQLVEMDTDPDSDRQALDANPYPDPAK